MCSLLLSSCNNFFLRTRKHDKSPEYRYDTSDVEVAQQAYLFYKKEKARDLHQDDFGDSRLRRKYKEACEEYSNHCKEVRQRHGEI